MEAKHSGNPNADAQEARLILHSVGRAKLCPNISPFVLKLETYLRMAGISYKLDTNKPFGSKGKTPWITIDGEDLSDSQLIIDFLNKKLNKNLWGEATSQEKAISQSMRVMLEDHFLCALADWRWVTGLHTLDQIIDTSGFKFWIAKMIVPRKVKNALYTQGIGRHSPEDRFHLLSEDLRSVSIYLGDKPFFLGDEPTEIDCTIFGLMAQFVYSAPGSPYEKLIDEEFANVKNYCERMKEKFWPDWDSLLDRRTK